MEETREISALFHLMDDPDGEIFSLVSDKIISFGKNIIPNLEHLWENTPDENVQERIESLIHRVQFRDLTDDFNRWKNLPGPDLLGGALLVAKYQYPDLTAILSLNEIEKMRRNIWLELNTYLTPLEQTKVLTTILYKYYRIQGIETAYNAPNDFLLNKLMDTRKGNSINTGILLIILCDLLHIPVLAINIPKQFILAYFDAEDENWNSLTTDFSQQNILFYIDPVNGHIYTQNDVNDYLKRLGIPSDVGYFKPLDNKKIVQLLLEELAKCYEEPKHYYKQAELLALVELLND